MTSKDRRVAGFVVTGPAEILQRAIDAVGVEYVATAADAEFADLIDQMSPSEVPSASFVDQARRNAVARSEFLDDHGALDAAAVHEIIGSSASNERSTASRLAGAGRIFAVEHRGRTLYPAFQFSGRDGVPKPAVRDVLASLPPAMKGWERALWWAAPLDVLGGSSPASLLDSDPAAVVEAARAEADDWAFVRADDEAAPGDEELTGGPATYLR